MAFLPSSQFLRYIFVGLCQLGVDWLIFSGLFLFTGQIVVANVTGRACAPVIGFILNSSITFTADSFIHSRNVRLFRYAIVWLFFTIISTVAIIWVNKLLAGYGFDTYWVIAVKIGVEGLLATVGFVLCKNWVFTSKSVD